MRKPTHPFELFYYFTSCYGVSLPSCSQSLHQRLPDVLMINRAVIFTLPNLILTIPIDNRHCFTQRFSPTGFILNALDSNGCHRIASARIQVKTYLFNSLPQAFAVVWVGDRPRIVSEIARRSWQRLSTQIMLTG